MSTSSKPSAVPCTDQWPSISIVIPVHNGGSAFRRCLKTVTALDPPPQEIVVVADGDTDDSAVIAEQFHTLVIRLPQRGGPARARNQGALEAQGEILLFLDADVAVPCDLLRHMRDAFRAAPDTVAIIGSYDCEPAAGGLISQYKNLMHHHVHQYSDADAATFWGACGAIRRDVFLAVGGFDERYRRPCVEDIDLGYRLRAARYPVRLMKALQVKHLKRWTFVSLLKSDIFDRALPWTELIMRHRVFRSDLNLRHSDRLSVVAIHGLLLTMPLGAWSSSWLAISGALGLVVLMLNIHTYRFFSARRGITFAVAALGLHWLSLIYSGMAFAAGTVRYGLVPLLRATLSNRSQRTEPFIAARQPKPLIARLNAPRGGDA